MATANHEVTMCECGHGSDQHVPVSGKVKRMACVKCPCHDFKATVQEAGADQLRRITED